MKTPIYALLALLLLAPVLAETFEDSRVIISAPDVMNKGYNTFTITPKSYTGDIIVLYGFERGGVIPSRVITTRTVIGEDSITCPPSYGVVVDNVEKIAYCYNPPSSNGTVTLSWSVEYDRLDSATRTAYWTTSRDELVDVSSYFTRIDGLSYDDKKSWYASYDVPVRAGESLVWWTYFDAPLFTGMKYDLAFIPSVYGRTVQGVINAYNDDNLYLLDPFINTTRYYAGDDGVPTNAWTVDDDPALTTVHFIDGGSRFLLGSEPIDSALEQYLRLDGDTTDSSGNEVDAVNSGATSGATGVVGTAYNFGGTINHHMNTSFYFTTANDGFAVGVWMISDLDTVSVRDDFYGSTSTGDADFRISLATDNYIEVFIRGDDGSPYVVINGTTDVTDAAYHSIILSYDAETDVATLYLDGAVEATGSIDLSGGWDLERHACLGCRNDGGSFTNHFDGQLDELFVLSRPITAYEAILYHNGSAGNIRQESFLSAYDTAKNLYRSTDLASSILFSSFTPRWNASLYGYATVLNATCNSDDPSPSWTGALTNQSLTACPVTGDSLAYEFVLTGNESVSPVVIDVSFDIVAPSSGVWVINASSNFLGALSSFNLTTRPAGGADPYYFFSTTNGTIITNISESLGNWWADFAAPSHIGQVFDPINVSSPVQINFSYDYPEFRVINASNNDTGALITSFNITMAQGATTYNYSTTSGTITTDIQVNDGLFIITVRSEGYYNRTYNDVNVSTNLTAVLFPTPEAPAESSTPTVVSGGASDEMYLFIFLFLVLGFCWWLGWRTGNVIFGMVAFFGYLLLFLDVLTSRHFTIFADYQGLLVLLFGLLMLVVGLSVFQE